MERCTCIWTNEGMEGCYKDAVAEGYMYNVPLMKIAAHPLLPPTTHTCTHKVCYRDLRSVHVTHVQKYSGSFLTEQPKTRGSVAFLTLHHPAIYTILHITVYA